MDIKRNKPKKYHHAIPIDMHEKTDLRTMQEEICQKEVKYLNP